MNESLTDKKKELKKLQWRVESANRSSDTETPKELAPEIERLQREIAEQEKIMEENSHNPKIPINIDTRPPDAEPEAPYSETKTLPTKSGIEYLKEFSEMLKDK